MWISCMLTHQQGPTGWEEITDGVWMVDGTVWIIDKVGDRREDVIESLMIATGWDGTMEQLLGETNPKWKPLDVEVVVKKEMYKEVERHRIAFIEPITTGPGAIPISNSVASKLKEKFAKKKPNDLADEEIPF